MVIFIENVKNDILHPLTRPGSQERIETINE